MMKRLGLILVIAVCFSLSLSGKKPKANEEIDSLKIGNLEWLDTVQIAAKPEINDYNLLGVYAGAGGALCNFNPSMKNTIGIVPVYVGVQYTNFGKMFGLLPYFGFQAGAEFTQEGYTMKMIDDSYINRIVGYSTAKMNVAHAYYQALIHVDFWKMRVMAHVGAYVGARISITRGTVEGDRLPTKVIVGQDTLYTADYKNKFLPFEYQFDYGVKAGVGFAFIFDPIEIHINGTFKHSLMNLYKPDYMSPYYYRWAYPMSFYISVGIHYQLTTRVGKSRKTLKQEALDLFRLEQKYYPGDE